MGNKQSQNERGGIKSIRSHTQKAVLVPMRTSAFTYNWECGNDKKIGHKIRTY